jgi:hypothetical protein
MIGNKYILAAALACAPFTTQGAETVYTFDSVAGIEHRSAEVRITGLLANATTPSTVTLPWSSGSLFTRCESVFNAVLSMPGAYSLTVVTETRVVPDPTFPSLVFVRCSSELKP